jgi:phosphate transport system permease protein
MKAYTQKGTSYIFSTGLGLLITLVMVTWIIVLILVKGLGFFWPGDIISVEMNEGERYMGELWEETTDQIQLKTGNRDVYGRDFIWLNRSDIRNMEYKDLSVTIERDEYGNFYGTIKVLNFDNRITESTDPEFLERVEEAHEVALDLKEEIIDIQAESTELMAPFAALQREISLLEISLEARTKTGQEKLSTLKQEADILEQQIAPQIIEFNNTLEEMIIRDRANILQVETAEGQTIEIQLSHIVRFFQPNDMNIFSKAFSYLGKLWEFIFAYPRESNTEGGVFPAIFGTVLMVLLMSVVVAPFGVLAAIYLNEYAKQGAVVRFIRLSVNNLAGVPSIVFGIFGLGFFVYALGGSIDSLFFSDKLPEPTFGTGGILWASLTLALLTLPVVVIATEEGILAVPRANKEGALALGSTKWQMIRKIVLPNAMPGILTGLILAISRGAGEVAPLMITGVVKLAPSLAFDWEFPFFHLDRKFMHLGFHIYDVGFQSPNVEASKPMVYSTALLLIIIVVLLNLVAIYIRNSLRKKYKTATF